MWYEAWNGETRIKNIDSIRIICNVSQNAVFEFYEEFFKLCGIYVIKTRGDLTDSSDKMGNYFPNNVLNITQEGKIKNIDDGRYRLVNAIKKIHYEERIKCQLLEILEIYLDNDLMYHNAMERYFYAPTHERLESCLAGFRGAVEAVRDIQKDERYVEYFEILCQHKINVLLGKLRRKKEYDGFWLINRAIGLCMRERGYIQGYILAGIIADGDLNYLNYSVDFYNKAFTGVSAIDAYIYYRRGRYYEKIEHDEEKALKDYQKAHQLDPDNYRVLYKVAFLEMNQGRRYLNDMYMRRAVRDFLKVCEIMGDDISERDLMPIQLEYLTKTYKKLYDIYDIWLEERYSAMQVLQRLYGLEQIVNNDIFFNNFFPEKIAEEEKGLLNRYLRLAFYKEKWEIIEQDYIINERGKRKKGYVQ